jgi:hypothetical protein
MLHKIYRLYNQHLMEISVAYLHGIGRLSTRYLVAYLHGIWSLIYTVFRFIKYQDFPQPFSLPLPPESLQISHGTSRP